MKPYISVIIPVFNGENNVKTPFDSLLKQKYNNFEVIIVDDGSTDKTSYVCQEYLNKDSRFKYIFQENAGVSAARNKGITMATGDYICFLDSDDYYEDTFLEKMYKVITDAQSDVAYCGYYKVTPKSKNKNLTLFKSGDILTDYILGKTAIHTTCWMIKKDLVETNDITFPKGVSWGEDFEFFFDVLSSTEKVCFVDEYLTNYTVDFADNRLSAFSIEKIDKDYLSISRILKKYKLNESSKVYKSLVDYRLSALITYRLIEATKHNIDPKTITKYYNNYRSYIIKFSFNNGLRSIKLSISKIHLLLKMRKFINK